jgi:hypothetical protein
MNSYQLWTFNYATGLVEVKTGDRLCTAAFLHIAHEPTWGADWITACLVPHLEPIQIKEGSVYCGYERLDVDTVTMIRPDANPILQFALQFFSTRTIRRSHELTCLVRVNGHGAIANQQVILPSIPVAGHQHKR